MSERSASRRAIAEAVRWRATLRRADRGGRRRPLARERLDDNILGATQTPPAWRIRSRKIGLDLGRRGLPDLEVLALLIRLRGATFFSRDLRLGDPKRRHDSYCLVTLDVGQHETATFVRRVLRHRALNTRAKRLGSIVRASHTGLRVWRESRGDGISVAWSAH